MRGGHGAGGMERRVQRGFWFEIWLCESNFTTGCGVFLRKTVAYTRGHVSIPALSYFKGIFYRNLNVRNL